MSEAGSLRLLLDIEQIKQLVAKYNFAFDNQDEAGYLACWTPDGYFERYNSRPRARGHVELAALVREFTVVGRHISSDFVIEVSGDTAVSENYCIYLDMKSPCEISMVGSYRDKLVRTAEGWKFSERIFEPYTLRESEANFDISRGIASNC